MARRAASGHGGFGDARAADGLTRLGTPRWRRALIFGAAAVAAVAIVLSLGAVIGAVIVDGRSQPQRAAAVTLPPPPLPPPQPTSAFPAQPPGRPRIIMNQPFGDSRTVFVVIGRGWPPGRPLTVKLAGGRASPEHPVPDSAGTFSYAINQDHEFFPAGLPLRTYQVVVTAPSGARAVTSFLVNRR